VWKLDQIHSWIEGHHESEVRHGNVWGSRTFMVEMGSSKAREDFQTGCCLCVKIERGKNSHEQVNIFESAYRLLWCSRKTHHGEEVRLNEKPWLACFNVVIHASSSKGANGWSCKVKLDAA